MSMEVKRVIEGRKNRNASKLKDVPTSKVSGWINHIEEISFTNCNIINFHSKINLEKYGVNSASEFYDLLNEKDCLYDLEDIIAEFKFSVVDEIVSKIKDNKVNFFNSNLDDNKFEWNVIQAVFPMYMDAFICMLDSWWSSTRQNKKYFDRLASDGVTETVMLSNIFIKYRRLSDNQLICDNYPIVVSVPSCISPINHPNHNNYSVNCLGGLMSPSSRFVSCDATSIIDIKSSLYHEALHCIFNTLKDSLGNDMYGCDNLSQFEEMVTHFNTDRFSSLENFRKLLSNIRLVFDEESSEIALISDSTEFSCEIQVDMEFDPTTISYLGINDQSEEVDIDSNDDQQDQRNTNFRHQSPMVSSFHEEIAKRMVESNTYNLSRDNVRFDKIIDFINNDDIIMSISCEQDPYCSNYHSFLNKVIKLGGKK